MTHVGLVVLATLAATAAAPPPGAPAAEASAFEASGVEAPAFEASGVGSSVAGSRRAGSPRAEGLAERGRLTVAVTAIDGEELERIPGARRPSDVLRMVNANTVPAATGDRLDIRGLGSADLGLVQVGGMRAVEVDWEREQEIEVVAGAQTLLFGTSDWPSVVCRQLESEDACRPVGSFRWMPGSGVRIDMVDNTLTTWRPQDDVAGSAAGLYGTPFQSLMVRGGFGMNRFDEESLDGFCDGAMGPCDVTTNQFGPELAIEARLPLNSTVTAGLAVGWTDLDGAEISVGDGPGRFEGYFRASAIYGQASFYFDVLDDYPQVRPYGFLGVARWSAESGSSAGSQSFSQDDSGTSVLFGAGVSYSGVGPGELGLSFRRISLSSDEHAQSPVDNSVMQLQLGYTFDLGIGR